MWMWPSSLRMALTWQLRTRTGRLRYIGHPSGVYGCPSGKCLISFCTFLYFFVLFLLFFLESRKSTKKARSFTCQSAFQASQKIRLLLKKKAINHEKQRKVNKGFSCIRENLLRLSEVAHGYFHDNRRCGSSSSMTPTWQPRARTGRVQLLMTYAMNIKNCKADANRSYRCKSACDTTKSGLQLTWQVPVAAHQYLISAFFIISGNGKIVIK